MEMRTAVSGKKKKEIDMDSLQATKLLPKREGKKGRKER